MGNTLFNPEGNNSPFQLEFHGTPLMIAWLPLTNFAVIIAALRWHKFSFYAHVFLALVVIGLTLGSTIPVLVNAGVYYQTDDQTLMYIHNYTGLIVTFWLFIEIVTGILARVVQYSTKINPNVSIRIKKIHHVCSYIVMVATKFNYLNQNINGNQVLGLFYVLLAFDIVFFIIYLLIKFGYWTLSSEIIDNQLVNYPQVE